jgi:hypothetical protein
LLPPAVSTSATAAFTGGVNRPVPTPDSAQIGRRERGESPPPRSSLRCWCCRDGHQAKRDEQAED